MTEITQKLLTEEKIPIAPLNGEDFDKLNISVDGYKAQCFQRDGVVARLLLSMR